MRPPEYTSSGVAGGGIGVACSRSRGTVVGNEDESTKTKTTRGPSMERRLEGFVPQRGSAMVALSCWVRKNRNGFRRRQSSSGTCVGSAAVLLDDDLRLPVSPAAAPVAPCVGRYTCFSESIDTASISKRRRARRRPPKVENFCIPCTILSLGHSTQLPKPGHRTPCTRLCSGNVNQNSKQR